MKDKKNVKHPQQASSLVVSRREVMAGLTAAALIGASPLAKAQSLQSLKGSNSRSTSLRQSSAVPRNMAAAVALLDGRIMVAGGYDGLATERYSPRAMSTAQIFDPATNRWYAAAPMNSARARHALVALGDGRIAAIGGMDNGPLATVEIYDPNTNVWSYAQPLAQPRYDHTAVARGTEIIVLGGTSLSVVTSVEVVSTQRETQY